MVKKIWFYWSKGFNDCPRIVKTSLTSLKKYSENFEINYLCEKTVWNFISNKINKKTWKLMSEQHRSDYIRISLLEKYGGLWIDATVIIMSSLESILKDKLNSGFFCLNWDKKDSLLINNKKHNVGKNRVIASWLFYADKDNEIIKNLRKEIVDFWNSENSSSFIKNTILRKIFRRIYKNIFEVHDPLRSRHNTKIFIRRLLGNSYLVINDCFADLIYKNKKCKEMWDSTPKVSALNSHQMIQFLTSKYIIEPEKFYPLQKLDHRLIKDNERISYLTSKIENN